MSIKSTKVQSIIAIKYKTGVDAKGKDILKSMRFSNIKAEAVDDDIYAIGTAIGTLLNYPITAVQRDDLNNLINQ